MKAPFMIRRSVLALLLLISVTSIMATNGQTNGGMMSSAPPAKSAAGSSVTDQDSRLLHLEAQYSFLTESLKASNEWTKYLVTAFASILAVLVAIQGIATAVQMRREGVRDANRTSAELGRDKMQGEGMQQVNNVLDVVTKTLNSRLTAEEAERTKAQKTEGELASIAAQFKELTVKLDSVNTFVNSFQSNIQNARKGIEATAEQLAQTPRHQFKAQIVELNSYSHEFETFQRTYAPIESEGGQSRSFSTRVIYVRGIAAHYANDPLNAREYLKRVVENPKMEAGETERAGTRRVANSHYYLGVAALNFGNVEGAIENLDEACKLDPDSLDFLTMLVTAEAHVMRGPDGFDKAREFITKVEAGVEMKKDGEGRLPNEFLRLRSRAALIKANMEILKPSGFSPDVVIDSLAQTREDDPGYYYATATLAQVHHLQETGVAKAKELFREAYDVLMQSGDFRAGEARSQILALMVAALCSRHGLMNRKKSDEHLDVANSLRSKLPKLDTLECTVFSTLSKRNENSETIRTHIGLIRGGKVLLAQYKK